MMSQKFIGKVSARFCHFPESGPRASLPATADGPLPQWPPLPTAFAAYCKGPGLTELLRLYVCGLQPRPSVQLSTPRVIANDNDISPKVDRGQAFRLKS